MRFIRIVWESAATKQRSMINFFRRIRQKLIIEGHLYKYLIYALGETFLVVIGILLALYINNWNQNSVNHKREIQCLSNIAIDLKDQIAEIDRFITYEEGILSNAYQILDHFNENKGFEPIDSIYLMINSLGSRATLTPYDNSYRELTSTGSLDLIRDDHLRLQLINYYRDLERKSQAIQENGRVLNTELINNRFLDIALIDAKSLQLINLFIEKHITVPDTDIVQHFSSTINNQLSNPVNELVLYNIVNIRILTSTVALNYYRELKEQTTQLLQYIPTSD